MHWGSPLVLVQDKKDLVLVVELDTVVEAQHKEDHYDGTRKKKVQTFIHNTKVDSYK